MKTALILGLVFFGVPAGWVFSQPAANSKDPPGKSVELLLDHSPVESGAPAVASYADVLDKIRPAVVSVYSTKLVAQRVPGFPFDDPLFRRFFGPAPERNREEHGLGSGVIVSADGYIITNNHVVEGADQLRVLLSGGREYEAELVGADPKTDVAVIRIEASGLPVATLADSDRLRVGDIVFALGNPLDIGQTVTMGIVSATGRSSLQLIEQGYESFIQTDASINMGNSGGPLVDAMGRVIGINTAILSTSRGNIGIGFAVPINLAAHVMRSLVEFGRVTRGYLGVNAQNLDPDIAQSMGLEGSQGAIINDVVPDGPAAQAGIRVGDVILGVNGRPIDSFDQLRLMVAQVAPGTQVELRLIRDGQELTIPVQLGTLSEDELIDGIYVAPVDLELQERFDLGEIAEGLVVTQVEEGSPYAGYLPPGMVILSINGRPVEDARQAREWIRPGRNLLLVSYRGLRRHIVFPVN